MSVTTLALGRPALPKILLVDRDADLLALACTYLSRQGYLVDTAANEPGAQDLLAYNRYDVIILALDLPGTKGSEICFRLRLGRNTTPIIMLLEGEQVSEESGRKCGADDILHKPFTTGELAKRIQVQLLKADKSARPAETLRCGNLELNCPNGILLKDGVEINLTPIEFALLELFMKHPQQYFSTDSLLTRVWSSQRHASDEAVRSSIKRLRRKIDDAEPEEAQSLIQSNRRVGYRFRPPAD
ncbi:MAG: response regulator transcription factor [Candidatus Obscuribacter sp.]|nr:response regulator transcription factor [Candidatus Melainabacteria bacterium]MDX1987625.1 response regulator transcription factor [Candidatus Obscuribacter sp.]